MILTNQDMILNIENDIDKPRYDIENYIDKPRYVIDIDSDKPYL